MHIEQTCKLHQKVTFWGIKQVLFKICTDFNAAILCLFSRHTFLVHR